MCSKSHWLVGRGDGDVVQTFEEGMDIKSKSPKGSEVKRVRRM
jgi:hypothetical protein